MTPMDALNLLGITRTIWIDDHFADTPETLADMLFNSAEVARLCHFPEINMYLTDTALELDDSRFDLAQALADITQHRRSEIKDQFLEKQREHDHEAGKELRSGDIQEACRLMGIKVEDRWTFDGAETKLAAVCDSGDADNAYIIDLRDAATPSEPADARGLQLLAVLGRKETKGTLFVLTHEATLNDESNLETILRSKLKDIINPRSVPVCVIAKDRIATASNPDMEGSLCVAIKRAGLRRSMYEVLNVAKKDLHRAFDDAEAKLLEIAPEQLDNFVVQKAYNEGASELHVVERALTASIGSSLRETFASDPKVQTSSSRLRALRAVPFAKQLIEMPDESLRTFRDYETWESDALLNSSLTPITCGDVFEVDSSETGTPSTKRFLLLGQACDMALRPGKDRDQELGIFIPLKGKGDNTTGAALKKPSLPFTISGKELTCDFRSASPVRLDILDLASFRKDGKVRFDNTQKKSPQLLDPQAQLYSSRCEPARVTIESRTMNPEKIDSAETLLLPDLQLTFSTNSEFKRIRFGRYEPTAKSKQNPQTPQVYKVTWGLRRCGRVRVPYAGYLLDRYYDVMGRAAFDLDYTAAATA